MLLWKQFEILTQNIGIQSTDYTLSTTRKCTQNCENAY
jgi:hypothetical protein